jgi:hypothetical protein
MTDEPTQTTDDGPGRVPGLEGYDEEFLLEAWESTDNTAERVKLLCQLAESLDADELQQLHSKAADLYGYPSLGNVDRAKAELILDRVELVRDFREDLMGL